MPHPLRGLFRGESLPQPGTRTSGFPRLVQRPQIAGPLMRAMKEEHSLWNDRCHLTAVLLGEALPSTTSAGSCLPLFSRFAGSMASSDFSSTYMLGVLRNLRGALWRSSSYPSARQQVLDRVRKYSSQFPSKLHAASRPQSVFDQAIGESWNGHCVVRATPVWFRSSSTRFDSTKPARRA
jgi:hypothetical protein